MTIGIYSITHRESGKRYIGKSIHIELRFTQHTKALTNGVCEKGCNRHLWAAVHKYGIDQFTMEILEVFDVIDERLIAERELYFMDRFRSCERSHGYNLRRDSSSKMIVHQETRALLSDASNRRWAQPHARKHLSDILKNTWADPEYRDRLSAVHKARWEDSPRKAELTATYKDAWADPEYRKKMSTLSKTSWADPEFRAAHVKSQLEHWANPEYKERQRRSRVARWENQDERKRQSEIWRHFDYLQYDLAGNLLRKWPGMYAIRQVHPDYSEPEISKVCRGIRATHKGFIWRREPVDEFEALLEDAA